MEREIVIKVDHVSKDFVLPHEKITTVKSVFTGMYKKRRSGHEVQHALHDISFEIKKGDFFGIVGRNGSGKSTLLKILANIYQPTRGSVTTSGKLVPFIELGVGFNPELTGRENVYLNGAMLGFARKEIDTMYEDIVAFAELERFMDQKLKNYSSGMQVRLAFSMATRSEADILLIDEVLAVGDSDFQAKCFNYFKQLKGNKKTVVFVSHDMNAVREYCDRALLIDDSKIVLIDTPLKVAGAYARLFTRNEATANDSKVQKRWGTGAAKISKPDVKVGADKAITLTYSVVGKQLIEDPVVGFSITNQEGKQICGTNSTIEEVIMSPIGPGKTCDVNFSIDNVLSDGAYTFSLAIVCDGGATVVDWWEDAINLTVKKGRHTPYLVDVPVRLRLKERA